MTTTDYFLAFLIFLAVCDAAVFILAWRAPEGYESEDGFYYGRRPGDDA